MQDPFRSYPFNSPGRMRYEEMKRAAYAAQDAFGKKAAEELRKQEELAQKEADIEPEE